MRYHLLAILSLCIMLSGCVPKWWNKSPSAPIAAKYYIHTVAHKGETLGIISNWYTGTPNNWQKIHKHNHYLNIHQIQVGNKIRIPYRLLKAKRRLPKKFVSAQLQKVKANITEESIPVSKAKAKYDFPVTSIEGCENLDDSFNGLNECANKISTIIEEDL